jgi:hypothetical protein
MQILGGDSGPRCPIRRVAGECDHKLKILGINWRQVLFFLAVRGAPLQKAHYSAIRGVPDVTADLCGRGVPTVSFYLQGWVRPAKYVLSTYCT